jgi:hypothetical protein
MKRSKFLTFNLRDFFKGLIVSVGTAVLIFLQSVVADSSIFDWKQVLIKCGWVATAAFITYLLKNLVTNNQGELLTPDK